MVNVPWSIYVAGVLNLWLVKPNRWPGIFRPPLIVNLIALNVLMYTLCKADQTHLNMLTNAGRQLTFNVWMLKPGQLSLTGHLNFLMLKLTSVSLVSDAKNDQVCFYPITVSDFRCSTPSQSITSFYCLWLHILYRYLIFYIFYIFHN